MQDFFVAAGIAASGSNARSNKKILQW